MINGNISYAEFRNAIMKRIFAILLTTLLAGCATGPVIDRTFTAVAQDSRAQVLVLHYTVLDFPLSLKVLTQQAVSSHYLVRDNPPEIYQLVDENRRAYHAGVSSWGGRANLNDSSIGIEIVNPGFTESPQGLVYYDYPKPQIDAVIALVKKIVAEHKIPPSRVIGHSDIAPQRKFDPGPRFPWKRFADEGLILWPDATQVARLMPAFEIALPDIEWFQQKLALFGYAVPRHGALDEETVNVIAAFQTRYRPTLFSGMPDAETAAMLEVLTTAAPAKSPASENAINNSSTNDPK